MVKEENLAKLIRKLRSHRKEEDPIEDQFDFYRGAIHFAEMNRFDRKFSQRSRIGKNWFLDWMNNFCEECAVSVNLVDQKSKHLKTKFTEPHHGYNKFTSIALTSLLSYYSFMFEGNRPIELKFHSHEKERPYDDNFEEYFEQIIRENLDERSNIPSVTSLDVNLVSTRSHREKYEELSEPVQFIDLLLGATKNAVSASSNKPAKLWFGRSMSHIINRKYGDTPCVVNSRIIFSKFPTPEGSYSNFLDTSLKPHSPSQYQENNLKNYF